MAVSEPDRHELYQALESLIGRKKAETMMSLLTPTGWGELATKRDLEAHQAAMKRDLEVLEARLNERIIRTALMINIPSILAAVALSFAATRLG